MFPCYFWCKYHLTSRNMETSPGQRRRSLYRYGHIWIERDRITLWAHILEDISSWIKDKNCKPRFHIQNCKGTHFYDVVYSTSLKQQADIKNAIALFFLSILEHSWMLQDINFHKLQWDLFEIRLPYPTEMVKKRLIHCETFSLFYWFCSCNSLHEVGLSDWWRCGAHSNAGFVWYWIRVPASS